MKKLLSALAVLLLIMSGCIAVQAEETAGEQASSEIEIETVETDAFSMNYFSFGSGEKTLVILPGLSVQSVMDSADAIADANEIFTNDFTVYVFDRRNELPEQYSIHEMAMDTAEAIKTLDLDHVSLFGASQGGMLAMEIAIAYPELVERMVLGSTSARVEEAQAQTIENWIRLAEERRAEDLYMAFGETLYPQEVFEQIRGILTQMAASVTEEELDRFMILAKGAHGYDISDELEKISCPVLAIGDREDHVLGPDATLEIAECLKDRQDFELLMYNGYGHAAYDAAPDYKGHMYSFLTQG